MKITLARYTLSLDSIPLFFAIRCHYRRSQTHISNAYALVVILHCVTALTLR
jgi:hypothetical protein